MDRGARHKVAGFYSFFSTTPQGEYRVLFSDCVADEFRGSRALGSRLCHALHTPLGTVRPDGRVSIDVTSCTGLCEQGPAMLVNGRAIARLTDARIDQVAQLIESRASLALWPAELFALADVVRRRDRLLAATIAPGDALRAALARGARGARRRRGRRRDRAGCRGRGARDEGREQGDHRHGGGIVERMNVKPRRP